MSPPKRRASQALQHQWREIDYAHKLSPHDYAYLCQFLYEYYQGDFKWDAVIHPNVLMRDCYRRNNATKRSIDSVGWDILSTASWKARGKSGHDRRYYTPEDYMQPEEIEDDEED